MFIKALIISLISILSSVALACAPASSFHIKNNSSHEVIVKTNWGLKDIPIPVGKEVFFSHCFEGKGIGSQKESSLTFIQDGDLVCGFTTYVNTTFYFTGGGYIGIDPDSIRQSGSIIGNPLHTDCSLSGGSMDAFYKQVTFEGILK